MATKTKSTPNQGISERLEDLIRTRGWAVVTVSGSPGFSYSVGLAARGLPEVIVFGVGPPDGRKIVGNAARISLDSGRLKVNMPSSGLIDDFQVTLRELAVDEIEQYLKAAYVRASGDITAVQLVWPDPNGNFPWEGGFDEKFLPYQPVLGPHPTALAAK